MKNDNYEEREYELIEEIEDAILSLRSKLKTLGDILDRMICEEEVEDFLVNGPGGQDPI
jgi:hypothetical protein